MYFLLQRFFGKEWRVQATFNKKEKEKAILNYGLLVHDHGVDNVTLTSEILLEVEVKVMEKEC
jgi:hypothetical protein